MGNLTAKTSGEIASFMSPSVTNIKSLKVHFSPKQLGTGDPSPENVREIVGWDGVEVNGSGKNLIPLQTDESYWSIKGWVNNNGSITLNSGYRACDYQKALPNKKYILTSDSSMWLGICFYDEAYNEIVFNQKNNTIVTLESPQNTKYYRIYATYRNNALFQLEISSDATSYEPYQGNNISYQWKLPDEYQEVEWIQSTGEKQFILLPYGFEETDTITITASIDTKYATDGFIIAPTTWNNNKNRFAMVGVYGGVYGVGYGNRSTSGTRLVPLTNNDGNMHTWAFANKIFDITDLGLSINVSDAQFGGVTSNLKLFYGYNKNIDGKLSYYKHVKLNGEVYEFIPCYRKADAEIGLYDIANNVFYTNDGTGTFLKGNDVNKTFYGGYIDLISGELVEEWGMFTVDEPDTIWRVNHPARITAAFPRKYIFSSRTMPRKSMCTIIPERSSVDFNYGYLDNVSSIEKDHVLFLNYTGNGSGWSELFGEEATNENVKEHLQEIGFAICATLATPITHQLTPTQLQSFVGQNNFWSNADYVEIEYDLIETEDIQKCRKKIMLNQPHTESVIGDVANFTTNMKAPLKECKVYFNPIQEGSGDPSPDNVRNIIGWDGVNVGLPKEYQEVEYIESTGTQYIITDIPIQQPVTIYIDVMPLSGSNDQAFFTTGYEASPHLVRIGTGWYAGRIQNYYQRYYTLGASNSMETNTKHHAEVYLSQGLQTAVLDGTQLPNTSNTHDSTLLPIDGNKINFFMFAEGRLRASGKIDALFKSYARIYALKVDNADSTIGNFIPCYRKSDGEIGMYDTVSKTFYTNSGTGTFLKGDDVNTIIGNVNWLNEIGTVYGGYVDLVKGELVGNWIKRDLSEMSTINAPNTSLDEPWNHRFVIENWDYNNSGWDKASGRRNFIIDNIANDNKGKTNFTAVGIDNSPIVYIYDNTISTVEEFKTKYKEHYICYEIKFPIRYSLTPQQLLTFKGENNIWSDTNGQTEVKFWTH